MRSDVIGRSAEFELDSSASAIRLFEFSHFERTSRQISSDVFDFSKSSFKIFKFTIDDWSLTMTLDALVISYSVFTGTESLFIFLRFWTSSTSLFVKEHCFSNACRSCVKFIVFWISSAGLDFIICDTVSVPGGLELDEVEK